MAKVHPSPAVSDTKILIQAHLQILKKCQFCNRVHPGGAHHKTTPSKRQKKKERELLILHYLNKLKLQTNAITPTKICLLPTESPNSGSYTEARGTCWCTHKLFPANLTSSELLQGARLLDQQHCPCVREKHLLFTPLSRLVLRSLFTQSSGTLCNENGEGFEPFASPQK